MAGFFSRLINKFSQRKIDWEELESELVGSDIGISLALRIMDELQEKGKLSPEDVVDAAKCEINKILPADTLPLMPRADGKTTVILVVGVNGTGKTTSSAKLGHYLKTQGYSVLMAAADTFRAAAVEQLEHWTTKLGLPLYKGRVNQDPASVCYEAHTKALQEGTQFLICDTAGRLHTRHNLMEELAKIKRTISKQDDNAPHVTYLVVDATTGANALTQAKQFHKATPLNGLIITKLDGSGKGGIAVAIMDELKLPPAFIGTGESSDDFAPFRKQEYINSLV